VNDVPPRWEAHPSRRLDRGQHHLKAQVYQVNIRHRDHDLSGYNHTRVEDAIERFTQ
jgi:hypothetical protein